MERDCGVGVVKRSTQWPWRANSHKYRRPGSPNEGLTRRLDRTCKGSGASSADAEAGTPHNASRPAHVLVCSGMLENAGCVEWWM